ncbi:hypothetical protein BKA93DRAFT_32945 [Sparassis latifolia]
MVRVWTGAEVRSRSAWRTSLLSRRAAARVWGRKSVSLGVQMARGVTSKLCVHFHVMPAQGSTQGGGWRAQRPTKDLPGGPRGSSHRIQAPRRCKYCRQSPVGCPLALTPVRGRNLFCVDRSLRGHQLRPCCAASPARSAPSSSSSGEHLPRAALFYYFASFLLALADAAAARALPRTINADIGYSEFDVHKRKAGDEEQDADACVWFFMREGRGEKRE